MPVAENHSPEDRFVKKDQKLSDDWSNYMFADLTRFDALPERFAVAMADPRDEAFTAWSVDRVRHNGITIVAAYKAGDRWKFNLIEPPPGTVPDPSLFANMECE